MSEVIGLKIQVDSNASEAVGSLRQQLRDAAKDAQILAQKFGENSQEAINAQKKVANLKESMNDFNDRVKAMNPEAKFQALSQSISVAAGGFAALQGAMGLMGIESEDLQKQLVKVQSAMALSQGLNSIMGAGDAFKNLALVIETNVVAAFGSMRAAIATTGIGALVIGLGILINKMYEYNKAAEEQLELEKKLAKERVDAANQMKKDLVNAIDETNKMRIDAMKDGSDKEIAIAKKTRDEKIDAIDNEMLHVSLMDARRDELTEQRKLAEQIYQNELGKIRAKASESRLADRRKEVDEDRQLNKDLQRLSTEYTDTYQLNMQARQNIRAIEFETMKTNQQAQVDLMMGLSELIGQETATGKALAIAATSISTYNAAQTQFEQASKNPITIAFPAYPYTVAAGAIVAGLAKVKQILAIQIPKGGGGSYGGGSASGGYSFNSGGSAPIQAGASVTTTSLSQGTLKQLQTQPIRAYVVENDITTNQDRIKRIEGAAVFGG